jgi:hypothetical protein
MSELGEGRVAALEFSRAFQGPDRPVHCEIRRVSDG